MLGVATFAALAALAADPWGRPAHLRAVTAPPREWSDLSATKVPIRLWWDGAPGDTLEIQGLVRGRWRTLAETAAPGWTSGPLPRGTPLRARRPGGRWSEIVTADPWISPAELAILAGPDGALLAGEVGEIAADPEGAWASTLGGGVARVEQGRARARSLTRWDGLPDDRVVAVDAADGRLLVGTARGALLIEPDGAMRVWDETLPDPYVQAVLLGEDALWIGTYRGLARVAGDEVQAVLEPWSVFSLASYNALDDEKEGYVWVGYEGLRLLDASGAQVLPTSEDSPLLSRKVFAIQHRGEIPLIASEDHGVEVLDLTGVGPAGGEELGALTGYPDRDGYGIAGSWVAAGPAGLVHGGVNGGRESVQYGRAAGLPSDTAWSVAEGSGLDELWVGTDRGLAWIKLARSPQGEERLGAVLPVALSGWPAAREASAILPSPDGAWVGGPAGLWLVGRPHPQAADLAVAADSPVAAIVRSGGYTWAFSEHAIRLDERGRLHRVLLPSPATAGAAWAGTVWAATDAGLWRYEPQNDRFVSMVALPRVRRLAADSGALWAVDAEGRVYRVIFETVRPYAQPRPTLALSPAGDTVCLGTRDGLERLTAETGAVEDVLGDADEGVAVPAVAADGAGGCWFAAEDGTVGRALPDGTLRALRLPGPDAPAVNAIVPEGDHAWILTDAGTWRVHLPAQVGWMPPEE